MRPREHRMREQKWKMRWENEQEIKRQRDAYMKKKDESKRLSRKMEKLRYNSSLLLATFRLILIRFQNYCKSR